MPALSTRRVRDFLAVADAATTNAAKGKAFEDLVEYVFGTIPGVVYPSRDVLNRFESEEVDVAFFNEQRTNGLKSFNAFLLIECKNWSGAVGSAELGTFVSKLRNRGLDFGVLIAANGITGSADDGKQAHHQASLALKDGVRIVVITRAEIEALRTSDDLVTLIKKKTCQLIAAGTVWP